MLARDAVGVNVLNWTPDFSGETRIPKGQRPSNGAETLVTEARRESFYLYIYILYYNIILWQVCMGQSKKTKTN